MQTDFEHGIRSGSKYFFLVPIVLLILASPAGSLDYSSSLLHNSDQFACSNAGILTQEACEAGGGNWNSGRKWADGWGVATGEYGVIACGTCHRKNSDNIKRISSVVTAASGTFPGSAVSAESAVPGSSSDYGDDSGGHTSSQRVCEICHRKTFYHRYDTTAQEGVLTHFNVSDCVSCHTHRQGFRAGCSDCHGNSATGSAWPDGMENNLNPRYRTADDAGSHNRHVASGNDSCASCHPLPAPTATSHIDDAVQLSGIGFTYDSATRTCSNISCHGGTGAEWGSTACLGCHSVTQGARAAIAGQFSANSHHVQGVAISDAHCYPCHWEAKSDGTINPAYHDRSSTAAVDLVIYGAGARPASYAAGATAVQYTANGTRAEIAEINDHCLGCHSSANDAAFPFGDGKTPKQYAWDGTSIDARYSQTGTTTWGKYTTVANAARKIQTKAYSAHGKAAANQGGWSEGASGTGIDGSLPNTRNGSVNVACFDCHNSHGSSVTGRTTSYSPTGGGLLKDTLAGRGGYSMTYQPVAGGTADEKNERNPGASLCFDCHLTADGATASPQKPWGYQATFGASKRIIGYFDGLYFASGGSGSQVRYPYKNQTDFKGGHFGASSPLQETPGHAIDGLCTPCHDPHGVSPTINQAYGVPLLKGTWLTSIYKEDVAPVSNAVQAPPSGPYHSFPVNYSGNYHIDQNTFGALQEGITGTGVPGITEDAGLFAGLCLRCHPRESLTSAATPASPNAWKSKDRVHEAVSGWKTSGTAKHKYTCGKCHTPHGPNGLPRLMITNCLDANHKGRVIWQSSPVVSAEGCCEYGTGGGGYGRIPGTHIAWYDAGVDFDHTVTCHDSPNANNNANDGKDQSWNSVTPWTPAMTISGLTASQSYAGLQAQETVSWTTNLAGDTFLEYWWDPANVNSYQNATPVLNHQAVLTGLENHKTYYVQARSSTVLNGLAREATQNGSFYISLPPTVPSPDPEADINSAVAQSFQLTWAASSDPVDLGDIQYYAEVSPTANFSSSVMNSGWISGTSWSTPSLSTNREYFWRVRSRDAGYTTPGADPPSAWSATDRFVLANGATAVSVYLDYPPNGFDDFYVTIDDPAYFMSFQWHSSPPASRYRVLVSDNDFATIAFDSGWIEATAWTIGLPGNYYAPRYYKWRVQAESVDGEVTSSGTRAFAITEID